MDRDCFYKLSRTCFFRAILTFSTNFSLADDFYAGVCWFVFRFLYIFVIIEIPVAKCSEILMARTYVSHTFWGYLGQNLCKLFRFKSLYNNFFCWWGSGLKIKPRQYYFVSVVFLLRNNAIFSFLRSCESCFWKFAGGICLYDLTRSYFCF